MQGRLRTLLGAVSLTQQGILKGALAAVVVTLIFPPFAAYWNNGVIQGLGFGFIFSWPEDRVTAIIHAPTLLIEWLAIGIVAAILWRLRRAPDERTLRPDITTLAAAIRSNNDAMMESARIQADAIISAAEITAKRSDRS